MPLTRREFLGTAALGAAAGARTADPPAPVIDTHTHFYDPSRPGGVPWPGKVGTCVTAPALRSAFCSTPTS